MKIITNISKENHNSCLTNLIESSDEMWLATAFLKTSGLECILPSLKKSIKAGKPIHFIAGQHFALTEPKALHTLRNLFDGKTKSGIYLAHAVKSTEVFHPKIYLFRKGSKGTIITGSANITGGGLINNIECSFLIETSTHDLVWKNAVNYFEEILSDKYCSEATLLVIKQYETFYNKQKEHNLKSKAIPERKKSQFDFNYSKLLDDFKKFDNANREHEFNNKALHYQGAKKVLDKIADTPRLTQNQFSSWLDELVGSAGKEHWWYSGSLFRLRKKVYPYYKEFKQLVLFIRENVDQSPSLLFSKAKELVNPIEGAGINYITEIMMTYNPEKFANMNNNPITVLRKEGGLNIKATSGSFSGENYEEYCEIIEELSSKLGLRNMLEADSFFNVIYWKIYKKQK